MLIVGAKGFAKEVLEVCYQNKALANLAFYDDLNEDIKGKLFNKFPIIKSLKDTSVYFSKFGNEFTIGIGNPLLRKTLYEKFMGIGGEFTSTISPQAEIGSYDVKLGIGCNILANSIFSNSVSLGKGCLIYYHTVISHDCILGDFVELSPGATLLGHVEIGNYCQIGANATILPGVTIGNNVRLGAGAVLRNDLPDHCTAVGVPAKIIKRH